MEASIYKLQECRMTSNAEINSRRLAAIPRGVAVQAPVYVSSALNAQFSDVEGREYIDFGGGMAVLNTGHLHPAVKGAVANQLEKFSHTFFQLTDRKSTRLNSSH